MTTYAINRSTSSLPVKIEFPDQVGSPHDYVWIQPKSKAVIPAGSRVVPGFLMEHSKELTLATVDSVGEPLAG